jgi:tetratricopeptide (TPR) repeat protein
MTTTTSETGVQAHPAEARELVERGIAAARGGQRRVAAGLLARALRLDPRDERAWLWLSDVVDDPAQRMFCLQAVLQINPANPYARRGLAYLQRQGTDTSRPVADLSPPTVSPESTTNPPPPPSSKVVTQSSHDWWFHWRWQRRETSRVRLVLWLIPIVLLTVALLLHQSVSRAREEALAALAAAQTQTFSVETTSATALPTPTPLPVLEAEPLAVVESLTVSYLSAVDDIRAALRTATDTYRQETSQPGGASVNHVAATQRLRATVAGALATLGELRPPGVLVPAHEDYRRGLELELAGLDAILEFYSTYDVSHANRAALRFQEARAFVERAQLSFQTQRQLLGEQSLLSAYTIR